MESVLPGYAPAAKPLYFVIREHLRDSPNVRAFRGALVDHLSRINGFTVSADLYTGGCRAGAGMLEQKRNIKSA